MFSFRSFGVIFSILLCRGVFGLPNDIEKCKINDERCLQYSANLILRKHFAGIEDIGLFSLDPLFVEYAKVSQRTGPVTVEGSSTNTLIRGFNKGRVYKIRGFDRNRLEIRVKVPILKFRGNYQSQANVIGIPISGNGPYYVVFNNFDFTAIMNLTRVDKDGKEFFKIVNTKSTFDTTDGEVDIPDLGSLVNLFLNASFNLIKGALHTNSQ